MVWPQSLILQARQAEHVNSKVRQISPTTLFFADVLVRVVGRFIERKTAFFPIDK
jgi:hypothetical protein